VLLDRRVELRYLTVVRARAAATGAAAAASAQLTWSP